MVHRHFGYACHKQKSAIQTAGPSRGTNNDLGASVFVCNKKYSDKIHNSVQLMNNIYIYIDIYL